MMWLAERSKVVWIEEQLPITMMWPGVIDFRRHHERALLLTLCAPWMTGQLRRTHRLPLPTVVQLLDCRVPDHMLGRMR